MRMPADGEGRDLADLNFVLAHLKEKDALKARAERYEKKSARPRVTFAVGVELLFWCRKHDQDYIQAMGSAVASFDVEQAEELATAAHILQKEGLKSPFDAIHLSQAFHRGVRLVTADEALWRTKYPTARF